MIERVPKTKERRKQIWNPSEGADAPRLGLSKEQIFSGLPNEVRDVYKKGNLEKELRRSNQLILPRFLNYYLV